MLKDLCSFDRYLSGCHSLESAIQHQTGSLYTFGFFTAQDSKHVYEVSPWLHLHMFYLPQWRKRSSSVTSVMTGLPNDSVIPVKSIYA
ncbi:uncharacterized protein LOC111109723 isoform X2 [Crassostrea virginica]